jgi:hypothetical protein
MDPAPLTVTYSRFMLHHRRITLQFCHGDFLRNLRETLVGGENVLKDLKGSGNGFKSKRKYFD